ncbi:hypothetical protein EJB05_26105 [Eragrostis curvula]|uniref:Uncharacterized protein n=1 Tax=Eragrostis curvula TaxID=38414 RepID=A0A5J9UJI6_9POAL|nr:hypothetical protein EJB05_26105 [Eragrostis curvula]
MGSAGRLSDLEKGLAAAAGGTDVEEEIQRALGMIYAGFGLFVVFYMLFIIVAVGVAQQWWQALVAGAIATLVLLLGLYLTAFLKRKIETEMRPLQSQSQYCHIEEQSDEHTPFNQPKLKRSILAAEVRHATLSYCEAHNGGSSEAVGVLKAPPITGEHAPHLSGNL